MAKKRSFINKLILAPWWLYLILAGVSYYTQRLIPEPSMPDIGRAVSLSMIRGIVFVLPYFLVLAAIVSLIRSIAGKTHTKR